MSLELGHSPHRCPALKAVHFKTPGGPKETYETERKRYIH
jgi:hypothetical protein